MNIQKIKNVQKAEVGYNANCDYFYLIVNGVIVKKCDIESRGYVIRTFASKKEAVDWGIAKGFVFEEEKT